MRASIAKAGPTHGRVASSFESILELFVWCRSRVSQNSQKQPRSTVQMQSSPRARDERPLGSVRTVRRQLHAIQSKYATAVRCQLSRGVQTSGRASCSLCVTCGPSASTSWAGWGCGRRRRTTHRAAARTHRRLAGSRCSRHGALLRTWLVHASRLRCNRFDPHAQGYFLTILHHDLVKLNRQRGLGIAFGARRCLRNMPYQLRALGDHSLAVLFNGFRDMRGHRIAGLCFLGVDGRA